VEAEGAGAIRPVRLRADWVVPVEGEPVRDAAVLLDMDGRIAALGPSSQVPTPDSAETRDLAGTILLPGLVNTHTHLELTGFDETASGLDFRQWILSIRRLKLARTPEQYLEAARQGIRDCWAGGVTTVADTGDSGAVVLALSELGGSGIVYHEVFGPHPEQLEASFAEFTGRFAELVGVVRGRIRLGVSPHAPYTVSGPLYSRVSAWARERELPMAVHISESKAEQEFVSRGTGPFAEAWSARGIPLLHDPAQRPTGSPAHWPTGSPAHRPTGSPAHWPSPIAWLDAHGVLGDRTLCIHAIQLDEADIRLLADRGAAVAHCPVSNAAHGHGTSPVARLRAAGVRVGLGTDSVASVGPLDLWREMRAAQSLAGLSDRDAVALATLESARALGLEREIGSIRPGKWGDLVAVRASDGSAADPIGTLLRANPSDVLLTLLGGVIVHRPPPA